MDPEQIDNTDNTATAPDTGADTSAPGGEAAPEPTLLDAINEGIADASPKPKDEMDAGKDETTTDDDDPSKAADGTRERDEHGRFKPLKSKEATPDPAKAGADKGAKPPEGEAKPAAKQPDPVNDPIPDDVKGKTRERMETLIKTAKEVTTRAEKAETDRAELLGYVAETRATPEQFTQALGYLKAVNSGDPAQIRTAIKTVQAELNALSRMIGEPIPGVDLLAEHQDLKEALEAGDLSQQHAQEIAAARAMRATQNQASQHQTEQQRVQQEVASGKAALNQLEAQLTATDPQYAAKRAIIVPMLQPVLSQLHPSKWAAAFKEAYAKLPATAIAPAPAPANVQQRTTQQQQPLRAKQTAGQTARAPGSLLDAITMGVEEAARR